MNPELLDVIRIKVNAFRGQECKEVLQQLGLPRSGNKAELVGRILTIFQDAATLTAQGHTLRDQGRVDAAAAVVHSIFQKLVQEDVHSALCANAKLKRDYAGAAAAADADADAAGPNKRPRLVNPLLPQHRGFKGTAAAAGGSDVDEIIAAFVSGDDCTGASNTRVRCVCSNHVRREPMLQCEGAFCGVWQHATCVKQQLMHSQLVPHPPGSEKWPKRRQFFCERCRVARADPFWEVYDTLVMPPQLGRPTESRMRVTSLVSQTMEWTLSVAGPAAVSLNSHQRRLLHESPQEYQLQVMALCLDDKVQFRLQWPTAPMLRFNGHQLRVVNRGNGTGLGVMQRDAPCNLSPLLGPPAGTQGASFDVTLEYADPHHTVLLLAYIMRRRTREQVKALMKAPEPLPVAVQRVQQFMNPNGTTSSSTNPAAAATPGGRQQPPAAAAGDDGIVISDDDDIVLGNRVVSLKDPNTFLRIKHPARFTDTTGNDLQVFELESFLEVADKTFKWIDPHSMKASCVQNMQVDAYMAHIIASLAHQPDVLEVEINEAAEWRPAGSSGAFRSVQDPQSSTGAAAAAGGGGGAGDMSSDEEDEAAELRRAVSEMRRSRHPVQEVIEILDSDDEEQPPQSPQQQQPQQPAGGGGLRIALPSRAQQQQEHLQQQAAVATMAAAAVGPPVPHAAAPGGGVGLQASAGSGGGGVLSPRVVSTAATHRPMQPWQLPPLHQQHQPPPPPLQPPQQQQILQVQQQVGSGPGLQGFAPPRLGSGDVGLGFPMGPPSGGGMGSLGGGLNPQQQQQQQGLQQGLPQGQVQGQLLHYTCPGGGQSGTVLCVGSQLYVPVVTGGGYLPGVGGLAAGAGGGGGGLLPGGQQSQAQMVLQAAGGLQQQGSGGYQLQQQGSGSYQVQQHQQQQQPGQQHQLQQQQQGNMPYVPH